MTDSLDILKDLAERTAKEAVNKALQVIPERINRIEPKLMTIAQAAEYMGISKRKFTEYLTAKLIPAYRDGGVVRVAKKDVDFFIEQKTS